MKKIASKIKTQKSDVPSILLIGLFLLSTMFPTINAENLNSKNSVHNVIYVPDDYPTIHDAINHAINGDTIVVRDGKYYEDLVIDKSITLKSENGSANCIIDGGRNEEVVVITADNVTIEGFTITGSWGSAGLRVESCDNTIVNNTLFENEYGIYVYSSARNNIIHNCIFHNRYAGIYLGYSDNNIIAFNNIYNNTNCGIYLHLSSFNNITHNCISNNSYGIDLEYSENNTITQNNISNNSDNIFLRSSSNSTIIYNGIFNSKYGIYILNSRNITIKNNTMIGDSIFIYGYTLSHWNTHTIDISNTVNGKPICYLKNVNNYTIPKGVGEVILANCTNVIVKNQNLSNQTVGIELGFSSNCIINNDNLFNNYCGIHLCSSSNNLIYLNNFIENRYQVILYHSTNRWYSPTKLSYIYNETNYQNYLGNYWSDYDGKDKNGDGIGDKPYAIEENNTDSYPLMGAWQNGTIIDTTPPHITIISPLNNFIINNSSITIYWQGGDYWTGIDHYEVKVDNNSWINVGLNTSYTTQLFDGLHKVEINAVDKIGNEVTTLVTFTVDTIAPHLTITSPSNGAILNISKVTVVWEGFDNGSGIGHYEIKIDKGCWMNVGLYTSYIFTNLSNGRHTVYIKAVDKAGNEVMESVKFVVNSPVPSYTDLFITALVVISVSIITLISVRFIRKHNKI